jgi:hypothetical protein
MRRAQLHPFAIARSQSPALVLDALRRSRESRGLQGAPPRPRARPLLAVLDFGVCNADRGADGRGRGVVPTGDEPERTSGTIAGSKRPHSWTVWRAVVCSGLSSWGSGVPVPGEVRASESASSRRLRLPRWTNTEHAGRGPIHYCNRSRKRACGEALRVFLPHVRPAPDLCARVTRPFYAPSRPARSIMSAELPVLVVSNLHSCLGIESSTGSWPASDDAALGESRRRRSGRLSAWPLEIKRGPFLDDVHRRAPRASIGHRISTPKSRCGPRSSPSRWP